MKRVLVTGATGFVGRQTIAPLLARGYEVHAIARHSGENAAGLRMHACDLLDINGTARVVRDVRPSHLLHLAWYTKPGHYWTSDENLRWLEASIALARAFGEHGGTRLVGVGSCAEYEWSNSPLSEHSTPLVPTTLYGTCKHALASVLGRWASLTGRSFAWGRLFFLFGPNEHSERLVPSVIRSLLAGREAACTSGVQRRDFQHVADAAAELVALLDSEVTGPVNIASGRVIAVRDLVLAIADKLDARHLVRLGARPLPASEPDVLEADISRLRDEVGARSPRDLSIALDDTIAWWRR